MESWEERDTVVLTAHRSPLTVEAVEGGWAERAWWMTSMVRLRGASPGGRAGMSPVLPPANFSRTSPSHAASQLFLALPPQAWLPGERLLTHILSRFYRPSSLVLDACVVCQCQRQRLPPPQVQSVGLQGNVQATDPFHPCHPSHCVSSGMSARYLAEPCIIGSSSPVLPVLVPRQRPPPRFVPLDRAGEQDTGNRTQHPMR